METRIPGPQDEWSDMQKGFRELLLLVPVECNVVLSLRLPGDKTQEHPIPIWKSCSRREFFLVSLCTVWLCVARSAGFLSNAQHDQGAVHSHLPLCVNALARAPRALIVWSPLQNFVYIRGPCEEFAAHARLAVGTERRAWRVLSRSTWMTSCNRRRERRRE